MSEPASTPPSPKPSDELAARRTGMAFQRTRMAADRTLMAVMRTSLSLIGFGFTIFQFFQKLKDAGSIQHDSAPRRFGTALVVLGVALLIGGIGYHVTYMTDLRRTREEMRGEGLVHAQTTFPISLSLIVAVLLLLLGLLAAASMSFGVGPLD
jgi:putative membrane protein